MRTAGGERGTVLVLVALALPVLLALMALVIDAGNWFTHGRQLQNRADAAVQAAGLEFASQWARCTSGTPVQRVAAQLKILAAAKDYAGDSYNAEIARVASGDILINSGLPNLCNPLVTSAETKVTEQNIDSLFASFGLSIGQRSATSRVDLLQAASDTGFTPLALEDQRIVKAQARFFNGCTSEWVSSPVDLSESTTQSQPGMTLWDSPVTVTLPTDGNANFGCPSSRGPRDYEPVGIEIKVASRNDVDLSASCSTLIAAPFAECYSGISQIRAWAREGSDGVVPSGDAPRIHDVALSGPSCDPDPYYARLGASATSCTLSVTATMNWLHNPPPTECEAWLVVSGTPSQMVGPCGEGVWVGSGVLTSPGKDEVGIRWTRTWTAGVVDGRLCTVVLPCVQGPTTAWVHRTNLADDPATDASPSDIVQLVKVTHDPGGITRVHSEAATGQPVPYYITVGLKSELGPLQFATLRTRFPGNRALVCDPDYLGGQTEAMVADGCKPPFGANGFGSGFWWTGTACPLYSTWFSAPYSNTPWRCLRTEEQTASTAEQLADGIAARTGNCSNSPGCGVVQCNTPNRYAEYFTTKTLPIDPTDRRFVPVFVLPFGSLKGPADNAVPVLDIAYFYVTGWGRAGANGGDPCPGADTAAAGRVAGYFVSTIWPNVGPTEPNRPCDPSALRPCRAVLVR
jgi:hypothetical protein